MTHGKKRICFASIASALLLAGCGGSDSDADKDGEGSLPPPSVSDQQTLSKQYNSAVSDAIEASKGVDSAYQKALAIDDTMSLSEVQARIDSFLDALLAYANTLRK